MTEENGGSRMAILRVAERLVIDEGLPAATIRAIAGEAGVNSALPRYYFGSAEGLQLELARFNLAPVLAEWKRAPGAVVGLDPLVRGYIAPLWTPAWFNPHALAMRLLGELAAHGSSRVQAAVARPLAKRFDDIVGEISFLRHGLPADEISARLAFACAGALGIPREGALFAGRAGRFADLEESVAFTVALMRMPSRSGG